GRANGGRVVGELERAPDRVLAPFEDGHEAEEREPEGQVQAGYDQAGAAQPERDRGENRPREERGRPLDPVTEGLSEIRGLPGGPAVDQGPGARGPTGGRDPRAGDAEDQAQEGEEEQVADGVEETADRRHVHPVEGREATDEGGEAVGQRDADRR